MITTNVKKNKNTFKQLNKKNKILILKLIKPTEDLSKPVILK